MAPVTWFDRLRIERVARTLDQRLYDLPRKARIAHRRELRQNLLTAARDVGTGSAIRNLGNGSQLASAYLASEFGDRPRHSWVAAAVWAATSMLVATAILADAANGFAAGIAAGDPNATGTFHWGGLSALQDAVTCTAVNGHTTVNGGGLSVLGWAVWLAIAVLIGRLWRAPASWRARMRTAVGS